MQRIPYLFAVLVLMLCALPSASAESTKEIYDASRSSVLLIITYDSANLPLALGSGFFSAPNEVATNFHVIDGAAKIVCRVIGEQESRTVIRVISVSKSLDLALLYVAKAGPTLPIREGNPPEIGEKVVAIGNPRGLEGTLSEGIVSGIRPIGDFAMIQITAPISPGSSGGPVFDEKGMVIGVATMTLLESQNLNFAVPAKLLATLRTKGSQWEPLSPANAVKAERGTAGLRLIDPAFADPFGNFAYSIKNENNKPITNVTYLLVFRNGSGEVIHFATFTIKDVLPPGLAIRRNHDVLNAIEAMKGYMLVGQNTYPFTVGQGSLTGLCTVELRPLTFDYVNSSPEDDLLHSLNR